jgi:hypothetical protein
MSWHIVGIEGVVPSDAAVVWGVAALSDGVRLHNPRTQVSVPLSELPRLRDDQHLHVFPTAIEIDDDDAHEDLVVLMIQRGTRYETFFLPETGRLGGVVTHRRRKPWHYCVFRDQQAFSVYANGVASQVLTHVLYQPQVAEEPRELVLTALTLVPSHPELNAIRAYLDGRPHVARLARASVRSDLQRQAFDLFLTALQNDGDELQLKYFDGAAQGGGFDVDVAAHTLKAVQTASGAFTPFLERHYPFLEKAPPPRLRELRAASAEFHFVPTVEGRPLGERVTRYLCLHFIEEALRGNRPADMPHSESLDAAIRTIAQPAAATRLQQKRLSETEREDVHQLESSEPTSTWSPPLVVLGVVSGLEDDSQAELWIGPDRRFFVSTVNDGAGERPIGADVIKGDGSFLRQPCVFWLIRESKSNGTERFHLKQMEALNLGDKATVTALPSNVVDGAFVTDRSFEIELRPNATLVTPLGAFTDVTARTLDSARRWLSKYREACKEFELAASTRELNWLPPTKTPEPSSLVRVLLVLRSLSGGVALATDVVAGINERFKLVVRVNNTRREVGAHPDLLEFVGADNKVIRLTDRGRAFIDVYVAAGGATGLP